MFGHHCCTLDAIDKNSMAHSARKPIFRSGAVWLSPLALGLTALAILVMLHAAPTSESVQIAVVFPPGTPLNDAIVQLSAVGGQPIASGWFPTIVIAEFDSTTPQSARDVPGAWAVFDAGSRSGCSIG